jgi:thioesterase domain-containing protein
MLPDRQYDLLYRDLALQIDANVPVYAIRPGHEGRPQIYGEESVRQALEALRSIQPTGPYRLAGYCLGGNLAFGMACELEEAGEQVEFLGLIDSYSPTYVPPPEVGPPLPEVLKFHYDTIRSLTGEEKARYLAELGVKSLRRRLSRLSPRRHAPSVDGAPLYEGHAHLFRAAELQPCRQQGDPMLGWSELIPGALELSVIPGDHFTILKEPYVREIVRRIDAQIAPQAEWLPLTSRAQAYS